MFSNREIASAIWLVPLIAWLATKPAVRCSCANVLKAFFQPKIVISVLLTLTYTVVEVWGLYSVHVWHAGFIKDTILWFCFSAVVMVANFVTVKGNGNVFKSIAKDNIKAVLVVEFVVNAFNFSLLGELAFVPLMTLLVMLNIVADLNEEHRPVAKLTASVLAMVGLSILYLSVREAIIHYQDFGNLDTLRSIALPPLLSILFSPFVFFCVLFATYEQVFMRLQLGASKPKGLVCYARRRIIWHFGCNITKLNAFLSANTLRLMQLQTRIEVDKMISDAIPQRAS